MYTLRLFYTRILDRFSSTTLARTTKNQVSKARFGVNNIWYTALETESRIIRINSLCWTRISWSRIIHETFRLEATPKTNARARHVYVLKVGEVECACLHNVAKAESRIDGTICLAKICQDVHMQLHLSFAKRPDCNSEFSKGDSM